MTPPDLLKCEPDDLAQYLLSQRFSNNSKDAATFLLQATSFLPNAEELSAELVAAGEDDDDDDELINLGDSLAEEIEISMIAPRGRLKVTLFEDGIYCINAKDESFKIRPHQAKQLVVFPKPEEIRKKGARDMVVLTLKQEEGVVFKKKTLSQLCFQLPNDSSFLENFRTSLNLTNMVRVGKGADVDDWKFVSHKEGNTSTTTGGMPFVKCYQGVQDGHLFPLQEGLLFFKPPLFVPRADLHSIACGRGASGQSRYVDLNIQLDDEETLEFTNIHREELTVLNDYIHKVLIPAMKKDAKGDDDEEDGEESAEAVELVDDETEDDDDVSEKEVTARRPKRKASKDARQATKAQMQNGAKDEDDDDDDEDGDDENWASTNQVEEVDDEEDDDDDADVEFNEEDDDDDEDGGGGDEQNDEDDDEIEEEVFFDEEDDDDATEEEEDERPAKKKRSR